MKRRDLRRDGGVAAGCDARWRAWEGFDARDPAGAARASVASLRARGAKIVIALVHVGGAADSKRFVRDVPGIDWAVLGHSGMNLEQPELVAVAVGGGARLLEAMNLGKNLGRLDLHVVAGDGRGLFVERAARAQLQTILADHQHQVAEYIASSACARGRATRRPSPGFAARCTTASAWSRAAARRSARETRASWRRRPRA